MERRDTVGLTPHEGRKFALTLTAAFGVLAAVFWWRGRETPMWVAGGVAGIMLLLGLVIPGRLGPFHRAWMRLALLISKVTTPVFMGVVYYLVLTPAGLLSKAFGRNPLVRGDAPTYWVARSDGGARQDMDHQF